MKKLIFAIIASFFLIGAIAGCEEQQGPMEQAGEKIDNTFDKAGNQVEDACEEVKEGVNADDPNC
jgi:hypothetical protein